MYEVLSGQTPFGGRPPLTVAQKALEGEQPERPQGARGVRFTDDIWGILELCWQPQPCDRISAKAVLWALEGNQPLLEPSSTVGEGVETCVDDQSDAASSDPKYVSFVSPQARL